MIKKITKYCNRHIMGINSNVFWLFAILNWGTEEFWFFGIAAIVFRGFQGIIDELRIKN